MQCLIVYLICNSVIHSQLKVSFEVVVLFKLCLGIIKLQYFIESNLSYNNEIVE